MERTSWLEKVGLPDLKRGRPVGSRILDLSHNWMIVWKMWRGFLESYTLYISLGYDLS